MYLASTGASGLEPGGIHPTPAGGSPSWPHLPAVCLRPMPGRLRDASPLIPTGSRLPLKLEAGAAWRVNASPSLRSPAHRARCLRWSVPGMERPAPRPAQPRRESSCWPRTRGLRLRLQVGRRLGVWGLAGRGPLAGGEADGSYSVSSRAGPCRSPLASISTPCG